MVLRHFLHNTLLWALTLLLSVIPLSAPSSIHAEETQTPSITISPSILELEAEPTDTITETITIENNTNYPLLTSIEATHYAVNRYGVPSYEENSSTKSAQSWILVNPADMILEPGEDQDVTITIIVPEDAENGSHFAAILFKPVPPPDLFDPHSAHILPTIGAIIGMNVFESDRIPAKEYLEILNFTPSINDDRNPSFKSEISNFDIYYHRIDGYIDVQNILGKKVYEVPIDRITLFPQQSRIISKHVQDYLPFGFYSATIHASDKHETVSSQTSFWVPPNGLEISIAALILLSVTAVGYLSFSSAIRTKKIKSILLGPEKRLKKAKSLPIPL